MSYGYPFVTKSTVNIYGFLATPAAVRAFSRRVRNEQLHGRDSSSNMLLEEVHPSTFGGGGASVLLKPERGLRGQLPPPRPPQPPPAAPIAGPPADTASEDAEPDAEMEDARDDAVTEEPPVNEEDDAVGYEGDANAAQLGEREEKRAVDYSVPATKYRDIVARYKAMKATTSSETVRDILRLNLKNDLNTLDDNFRPAIAAFTRMLDDNQRNTIQLQRELIAMKSLYAALNELVSIRKKLNNSGPNTEPRVDEEIWTVHRGRLE